MALSKLASSICSDSLPDEQIVNSLRVLGFRSSTQGIRKVLNFASALQPQFKQLEYFFPEAKKPLQAFQMSAQVLHALDKSNYKTDENFVTSSKEAFGFCTAICGKKFKLQSIGNYPLLADIIAFVWLSQVCVQAAPRIEISLSTAKFLRTCVEFIRNLKPPKEFHSNPNIHKPYFDDFEKWLASIPEIFEKASYEFSPTNTKEALIQCQAAIRQLAFNIPESTSSESTNRLPEEEGESNVPNQMGINLSERELLSVYHSALADSEIQTISTNISSVIKIGTKGYVGSSCDVKPEGFYEALIIALSLATARTIHSTIQLPIFQEELNASFSSRLEYHAEFILLEQWQGSKVPYYLVPVWIRKISTNKCVRIPLPSILWCLKSRNIYFNSSKTFLDCLPYTLIPWEERCHSWLSRHLNYSRCNNDRKLRDTLARIMYRNTVNSAMVTWLATPPEKISWKFESLSNYLNPEAKRAIKEYRDACIEIFGDTDGEIKDPSYSSTTYVNTESIRQSNQIANYFLDEIKKCESNNFTYQYHNAIVTYILMLLVIATGHRKASKPFFFGWDFLIDKDLVFISDKQQVGSEARLVPVPHWVSELIVAYFNHLVHLYEITKSNHSQLTCLLQQHFPGLTDGSRNSSSQINIGIFFRLTKDLIPIPISTSHLEKSYLQIVSKSVTSFRKEIANWFWNKNLSGYQIKAFLGHNGDMHIFGESSCWSIIDWAIPVRKLQETYLAEHGWIPINIQSNKKIFNAPYLQPDFKKSNYSYEGRELSSTLAQSRARKIIHGLISPEWYASETSRITDKDVESLKKAAQEMLQHDQQAYAKIKRALAEEIKKLRAIQGRTLASTITNLTRTDPGPMEISFSRYYSIACSLRTWWMHRVGGYSENTESNYIDRASSIGISLIIFDAVLEKETWSALLSSILMHQTHTISGCIIARANIVKQTSSYDKTIVASPLTTSQIIGLNKLHRATEPETNILKEVEQRINKWLKSAPRNGESLTVDSLITVYKSWWLPQLPGCLYSIAIGNHSGPAPDLQSECSLYGVPCSDLSAPSIDAYLNTLFDLPKREPKAAINLFNNLLSSARGRFELKQQTSKTQRQILLRLLFDGTQHSELKTLAIQVPIISTMLGFLQFLLEEGGKKVKVYRFNSITTYFSNINRIIDLLWDKNLSEIDPDELDNAYKEILKDVKQAPSAVERFHTYLRQIYNVPFSTVAQQNERKPIQCRSTLITSCEFKKTWDSISSFKDDGQLVRNTKSYLGILNLYGLRSKETLGLSLEHFLAPKPFSIKVAGNNVRDLKTPGKSSLHISFPLLNNMKYQEHLEAIVNWGHHAQVKNESIFVDTGKKNGLYSFTKITQAATFALRAATGNLSAVPYSLRHTVATRLAHYYVPAPRKIPVSDHVNAALLKDVNKEEITSCFKQGYTAWPFWLDRAAMHLGHASASTMLNIYWHSSHIRLSEHTWNALDDIDRVKPLNLSSMLALDRSVIHKKIKELSKGNENNIATAYEAVVAYYVNKSGISSIDFDFENQKRITLPKSQAENIQDAESLNSWNAYDRLLCARLSHGLSLEEMKSLGNEFMLPKHGVASFIDGYKNIIRKTGITDFEPTNSELLTQRSKRNDGVIRGSAERERGITTAQLYISKSDNNIQKLKQFCQIWMDRVSESSPYFIAHSINEISLILEVLIALGVNRSQLQYQCCNFDLAVLDKQFSKDEINSIKITSKGLSRDSRIFRESEFGIRVGQMNETKIGDNRDTHRMILLIAALVFGLN